MGAVMATRSLTMTRPDFLATNRTTPELTLTTPFLWKTLTMSPISCENFMELLEA
jgi:hypothetical protein